MRERGPRGGGLECDQGRLDARSGADSPAPQDPRARAATPASTSVLYAGAGRQATPPEVRDRLAAQREADSPEDSNSRDTKLEQVRQADGTSETDEPPAAQNAAQQADRRIWPLVVGLVLAGVIASGVAVWAWTQRDRDHLENDTADRNTHHTTGGPDTSTSAPDRAEASAPTLPLHAFAGRCTGVGVSETWFDTVYFYPDLGEVLLREDDKLVWAKAKVQDRRARRLDFSYRPPGAKNTRRAKIRASTDKLIIRIVDEPKFVCLRQAFSRYYETLGLAHTFHEDGDDQTLSFAPAVQRLTLGDTQYVYRVLGDSDLEEGTPLAVRKVEADTAPWQEWTVTAEADKEVVGLETGEVTRRFVSKTARAKQRADKTPRATKPSKTPQAAAEQPPSAPAPPTGSSPTAPSGNKEGASTEVAKRYKKKIETLAARCAKNIGKQKANIAHLEKLQEEERYEEAGEFAKKMRLENESYNKIVAETTKEYSRLITEMSLSGMSGPRIMLLSRIFTDECSWQ